METTDNEDERPSKGTKQFPLNLDDEDRDLLERLAAIVKLNRSDTLRIALRRYAKDLGLEAKPAA
jgi:uncharacterized protein (DUF1778 family)